MAVRLLPACRSRGTVCRAHGYRAAICSTTQLLVQMLVPSFGDEGTGNGGGGPSAGKLSRMLTIAAASFGTAHAVLLTVR